MSFHHKAPKVIIQDTDLGDYTKTKTNTLYVISGSFVDVFALLLCSLNV